MKGAIRYEISVKAVVQRVEVTGKEWGIVGQKIDEATGKPVDMRGYTPEIEKPVTREVEVFKQTVDELDLAVLVAAINGLARPA